MTMPDERPGEPGLAIPLSFSAKTRPCTAFEWLYRSIRTFDHPLYQRVSSLLWDLQRRTPTPLRILDVGGRRSNYTIGLRSSIIVSDLPRVSDLQHALDLGATDDMRRRVLARRSNVEDYVLDDMTRTRIPAASTDVVTAVEVLEHVDEDEAFVRNVHKVLTPGGCFVMTTPNGDYLTTPYADHKRHYRRDQLRALLAKYFAEVQVTYAIKASRLLNIGVCAPSLRSPLRTLISPFLLFLASRLEFLDAGGSDPDGKRHLVAVAMK